MLVLSGGPPAAARARLYALDSERFIPVRGLPPGGCVSGGTRLAGTTTWLLDWQPTAGPQLCEASLPGLHYLIDSAGRARRIGAAGDLVSGEGTYWWKVTGRDLPPEQQLAHPQRVQRITIDGRLLGPVYRLPAGWTTIESLAPDLLLLARDLPSDSSQNWVLWRPSTGSVLARYDRVLAAGPQVVAWVPETCRARRCPVHLSPTRGGPSRLIAMPGEDFPLEGSLSDDGRFLALSLVTGTDAKGVTSELTGAVLDVTTGQLRMLPKTRVASSDEGSLDLNWADPHWLAAGAPGAHGTSQLAAYNPVTGVFVVARHGLVSPAFPVY